MHCGAALRRPATALSAVIMSTLFVSSWHNSKFDLSAKKTPITWSLMFFILINRNLLSYHVMDVIEDQVAKQTRLIQTAVFWDMMLCSQHIGTNILEKPVASSSTWRWRQMFCLKHCYISTKQHTTEDCNLTTHHHQNLKFYPYYIRCFTYSVLLHGFMLASFIKFTVTHSCALLEME